MVDVTDYRLELLQEILLAVQNDGSTANNDDHIPLGNDDHLPLENDDHIPLEDNDHLPLEDDDPLNGDSGLAEGNTRLSVREIVNAVLAAYRRANQGSSVWLGARKIFELFVAVAQPAEELSVGYQMLLNPLIHIQLRYHEFIAYVASKSRDWPEIEVENRGTATVNRYRIREGVQAYCNQDKEALRSYNLHELVFTRLHVDATTAAFRRCCDDDIGRQYDFVISTHRCSAPKATDRQREADDRRHERSYRMWEAVLDQVPKRQLLPANVDSIGELPAAFLHREKDGSARQPLFGDLLQNSTRKVIQLLDELNQRINPNRRWRVLVAQAGVDGSTVVMEFVRDPQIRWPNLAFHLTLMMPESFAIGEFSAWFDTRNGIRWGHWSVDDLCREDISPKVQALEMMFSECLDWRVTKSTRPSVNPNIIHPVAAMLMAGGRSFHERNDVPVKACETCNCIIPDDLWQRGSSAPHAVKCATCPDRMPAILQQETDFEQDQSETESTSKKAGQKRAASETGLFDQYGVPEPKKRKLDNGMYQIVCPHPRCEKTFAAACITRYRIHYATDHSSGVKYNRRQELSSPKRQQKRQQELSKPKRKQVFVPDPLVEEVKDKGTVLFICQYPGCSNRYKADQSYRSHYRYNHLQIGLVQCPIKGCKRGAALSQPHKIARHIVSMHTDKHEPGACPLLGCQVTCATAKDLTKHIYKAHVAEQSTE